MITFRVVTVTNNLEQYPQHVYDNDEFPHLIDYVEDEVETFVVDENDGGFWKSSEFFQCTNVTHFLIDSSEAPA